MTFETILLYFFLAASVIAFVVFGLDKAFAKAHVRRVPEKVLFFLSLIGGSCGSLLAMMLFRHKTLHKRFVIGIPLILLAQILLLVFAYYF